MLLPRCDLRRGGEGWRQRDQLWQQRHQPADIRGGIGGAVSTALSRWIAALIPAPVNTYQEDHFQEISESYGKTQSFQVFYKHGLDIYY